MKRVYPGRDPSRVGVIMSGFAVLAGIGWIVAAAGLGDAPPVLYLFGAVFIGMAAVGMVYSYRNATRAKRMSILDVAEDGEKELGAPPDRRHEGTQTEDSSLRAGCASFCPYCGVKVKVDYAFCPGCGRKLESS